MQNEQAASREALKCFEIRDEKNRILSLIWAHRATVEYGQIFFNRNDVSAGIGRIVASALRGVRVVERPTEQPALPASPALPISINDFFPEAA